MREILFRGKRVDNNEWVYGFLCRNNRGNLIIQTDNDLPEVIHETIGQFTGLTDTNGRKIFEGDQLYICSGYASVVRFKDGMFVSVYNHPEDGEIIPLFDAMGKDTTII